MSAMVNVIPRITCFGSASYQLKNTQSRSPLAKLVRAVYNSLRSIDGLDEAGSAGGQTLPGIAAPIFTTGFMGVATPIVAIGATGAVNESIERFRDYPEILQQLATAQQRIIDLARETIRTQDEHIEIEQHPYLSALIAASKAFTQEKKNHQDLTSFSRSPCSQPSNIDARQFLKAAQSWREASIVPPPQLLHEIKQYQLLDAQRNIQQGDRNASVAGAVSMTGMTAGMLIATTSAATDIAAKANIGAAEVVADGLLTASGAVFLPAQAAMMTYGASKVVSGVRYRHQLQQDKKILSAQKPSGEQSAAATASLAQLLQRRSTYENHKISYGAATAVGQACMMGGNVMSLTGAGIVIAAPLFGLGVPLTLGAALQRIAYEKQEKSFSGVGASTMAREEAKQHNLIELQRTRCLPATSTLIKEKYIDYRYLIAKTKLFSLIDQILSAETKDNKTSVADSLGTAQRLQRQQRLEMLLPTGKKSLWRGTSLLKDDVLLMSSIWDTLPNKDVILSASVSKIREWMNTELTNGNPVSALSEKQGQQVLQQTVNDLIQFSTKKQASDIRAYLQEHAKSGREIHLEDIQEFAKKNTQANTIYQKNLAKAVIKRRKTDSKFLRQDAAKELFKAWHSQQEIEQHSQSV